MSSLSDRGSKPQESPEKGIWNDNGGDFMNESQINLELYHKMREEQDEYRSWLLSSRPRRS